VSETEILDAVEAFFSGLGPCGMLRQFVVGNRRIDAMIITDRAYRVAIEAKSTTADYRAETPEKRAPAEVFAHTCWYAAPEGVIDPETLPFGWGLLVVDSPTVVRLVRQPTPHTLTVSHGDVAALMWRCWQAERRANEPGSLGEARARIEALQGSLDYARTARAKERERAQTAGDFLVAMMGGEQECSTCEQALAYHWARGWVHVQRGMEAVCGPIRAEAYRRAREAATGAAYALSAPTPPVPKVLVDGRPDER
jgi:hypothetical protein